VYQLHSLVFALDELRSLVASSAFAMSLYQQTDVFVRNNHSHHNNTFTMPAYSSPYNPQKKDIENGDKSQCRREEISCSADEPLGLVS